MNQSSRPPESGAPPAQPRLVDIALRYLKREGIRHVFGVPGGLLHSFFDAVETDPDLALIVARHECGAAFMADGYARVSGRVAVAAATSGPGATNLLTGVAVAFADGVPMLVITGQAPSHAFGRGAAQETAREDIDSVGMFASVTRYSAMVTSPDQFGHHFRRAMRRMRAGRPGPVHLNVPCDLWTQPAADEAWPAPSSYAPRSCAFDRERVAEAVERLRAARCPLLLVGSGVSTAPARDSVRRLAEMLRARVATTPRAKGVFSEHHPLSLGVLGFAGHVAARGAMLGDEADLLFAIGASLNETTTLNWNRDLLRGRALIHLDVDPDRVGRNYPVDVPLVGDAEATLSAILDGLVAAGVDRAREGSTAHGARSREAAPASSEPTTAARGLHPAAWREELNRALPADAVIFSDIGGHMLFNVHHLRVSDRQRFVLNLGFGSMGHGTAAPVGAALSEPRRPVIAIIGDACFTMNGMEALTAREYDVPVVWIVESNQMHGITWHGSRLVNGGRPMESIVNKRPIDVEAIARAMGLATWSARRPGDLSRALAEALEARRPALIEVHVDPAVCPPLGDRAKTVAGFRDR